MSLEECKKRGKIISNPDVIKRIEKEKEIGNHFFKSAQKVITIQEYDLTILASYNSCFHFIRALLYQKEYTEKSHFCLIQAVKEFYKEDLELQNMLSFFNQIRSSRHEIQYRGTYSDKEECKQVLDFNEKLKDKVLEILKRASSGI